MCVFCSSSYSRYPNSSPSPQVSRTSMYGTTPPPRCHTSITLIGREAGFCRRRRGISRMIGEEYEDGAERVAKVLGVFGKMTVGCGNEIDSNESDDILLTSCLSRLPNVRLSRDDAKRNQDKVEQVKIRMGIQIDDVHFRTLLQDTQVLITKDYTKWNWENILELLQGPLLNPRRLEEAMRGSKFIKRLLAFYRPFGHRFSDIKATKVGGWVAGMGWGGWRDITGRDELNGVGGDDGWYEFGVCSDSEWEHLGHSTRYDPNIKESHASINILNLCTRPLVDSHGAVRQDRLRYLHYAAQQPGRRAVPGRQQSAPPARGGVGTDRAGTCMWRM
ncbi:LOW QUALITY PROTEIN: Rapamycin-insensitive companion of mTOR, middle domain-containing protein, partial [Jimgerdemannia flammicorona]